MDGSTLENDDQERSRSNNNGNDSSLLSLFQELCFSRGDEDIIWVAHEENQEDSSTGFTTTSRTSFCYLELQELAKQLAAQLFYRYANPEYIFIDCQNNTVTETVCILAALHLNRPFVPVQAMEDTRRLCYISELFKDKDVVLISTAPSDLDPIFAVYDKCKIYRVLLMDEYANMREAIRVPDNLPTGLLDRQLNDELYILFTSGSEGEPKAVVGSHDSTYRRFGWFHSQFEPKSRVARRTPLVFVDGITEILQTILHAGSILVSIHPSSLQANGITKLLEWHRPTQITLVPSMVLGQLLSSENIDCIERLILSGELCPPSLIRKLFQSNSSLEIVHLYGLTESTGDSVGCILNNLDPSDRIVNHCVAIGKPILPSIEIKQITMDGQLSIAGNLARGYYGSKPFDGELVTGDVGFEQNGIWYIRGRCTESFKKDGVWIHPGRIEAIMNEQYGHGFAVRHGDNVVFVAERTIGSPIFCRTELRRRGFTWNEIPNSIVTMKKFPMSASGKVNRKALADQVGNILDIAAGNTSTTNDDASTAFISKLSQILGVDTSSLDLSKSFIDNGGNSAAAVSLTSAMKQVDGSRWIYSATDLLESRALSEFTLLQPLQKRRKVNRVHHYNPEYSELLSSKHRRFPFRGCVDASPTVVGHTIYVGCQGGVLRRIAHANLVNEKEENGDLIFQSGYRIGSKCAIGSDDSAIYTSWSSDEGNGIALCCDMSLGIKWRTEETGKCVCPPLLFQKCLVVAFGSKLQLLGKDDGHCFGTLEFKDDITAQSDQLTCGRFLIAVSSDIFMISIENSSLSCSPRARTEFSGPIRKSIARLSTTDSFVITDSFGRIEILVGERDATEFIDSFQCPASEAAVVSKDSFVVGSHAGDLSLYERIGEKTFFQRKWALTVGASIYAAPTVIDDCTLVVVTTAGDILKVVNGSVRERRRIPAEILSSPCLLEDGSIAFGARDSHLHIMSIL